MTAALARQITEETQHCPGCDKDKPLSAWYASAPTGRCAKCRANGVRVAGHQVKAGYRTLRQRVDELESHVNALVVKLAQVTGEKVS